MSSLKPCPFCGGPAKIQPTVVDAAIYRWVWCTVCRAKTDKFYTTASAIDAWNRREGEEKPTPMQRPKTAATRIEHRFLK